MRLFITIFLFLLIPGLRAQMINISGLVVSAHNNEPIEGVTVKTLQTGIATATNQKGIFNIRLQYNDSISIGHSSYSGVVLPAALFATQTTYVVSLQQKISALQEVTVNTGLQLLPKERSTGSFEHISEQRLNEQVGATVLNRLEAVANGLYFDKKRAGTGTGIVVRGLSSIQGPKEPLIILDNFPYDGNLNNINPNDVESITILKDAAAASIWGSRAGNGVIVITTKKGKLSQPLSITLNNNITFIRSPDLYYQQQISSSDFIDVESFLYSKGFYNSRINGAAKAALSPVVELLIKKSNGSLPAAEADALIDAFRQQDTRHDFDQYMYQTAVNRQHAISLNAGTNKMSWNFSAGLDQNINNQDATYNRLNLKADSRFVLTKKLDLSAGVFYTSSQSQSGKPGYGDVSTSTGKLPPYILFADENGNALPVMRTYRQAYLDTVGRGRLLNWNYYPLEDHEHTNTEIALQQTIANIGLHYKILKGLQATMSYQYQQQQTDNNLLQTAASYFTRNITNSYSVLNQTTGVVTYRVPRGAILDQAAAIQKGYNWRTQLNYNKNWKNNKLFAIAGADVKSVTTTSNSYRIYGYNPDLLTITPVDYAAFFPNYVTKSTSQIPNGLGLNETTIRFLSVYANVSHTLLNKYTVSASVRNDASNLFGINTNQKWTPLWSAGAAWDVLKEKGIKLPAFSQLKLRTTYGVSGNADPSRAAVTTIVYSSTNPYTLYPRARIEQFKNADLRWEKTAMWNIGLDWALDNGRLKGSIEYYRKKGTDLFGSTAVDYTAVPASNLVKNTASMKGSGWDIELNSRNTTGMVKWETNMNLAFNKDAVTNFFLASQNGSAFVGNGMSISAAGGKPVYALYSYRSAGLDPLTGDPRGYVSDSISKDYNVLNGAGTQFSDLVYHGRALPSVFGSMGNTLSWKKFSLTARIMYKFGYYFRGRALSYNLLFTAANGEAEFANRWQQPGDELRTNVPSVIYPNNTNRDRFYVNSTSSVFKGDHVRFQYLTLNYQPDLTRLFSNRIKGADIYISCNNLGLIWKANKAGIDPDYRNTDLLPGISTSVGIKLNF